MRKWLGGAGWGGDAGDGEKKDTVVRKIRINERHMKAVGKKKLQPGTFHVSQSDRGRGEGVVDGQKVCGTTAAFSHS